MKRMITRKANRIWRGEFPWRLLVDLGIVIVAVVLVINAMGKTNVARQRAAQHMLQTQASKADADALRELVAQQLDELNATRADLAASMSIVERFTKQNDELHRELTSTKQAAAQSQELLRAEQAAAKVKQRELTVYASAIDGMLDAPSWSRPGAHDKNMADVVASGIKRMSYAGRGSGAAPVAHLKVLMARRLIDAGESGIALPMLEQAITALTTELGVDDPSTFAARIQLARAEFDQGRHAAAIENLKQLLESHGETLKFDATNSSGSIARRLLLDCLIASEQFEAAEPLAWQIARLPESNTPIPLSSRKSATNYLFPVLDGLGRHSQIESIANHLVASDSSQTVHTPGGFQWRCYLARSLLGQNKFDVLAPIESELRTTAAFLREIDAPAAPGLYGQFLFRRGDHKLAEYYLRHALHQETPADHDDLRIIETLKALVQLYETTGRSEQASHYREQLKTPSLAITE